MIEREILRKVYRSLDGVCSETRPSLTVNSLAQHIRNIIDDGIIQATRNLNDIRGE